MSYWSIGGNLNIARAYLAGCGTKQSALSFGDIISTEPFISKTTKEWSKN